MKQRKNTPRARSTKPAATGTKTVPLAPAIMIGALLLASAIGTAEIAYDMTGTGITDAAEIQAAVDVH
jgi:hypothetical protein